jgi:spermidine synthase
MGPVEYVELARASSDRGEVVLRGRRDPDAPDGSPMVVELRVNGVFVMDDAETSSEVVLAREALDRVEHPRSVLVGGLGLGFTAHEVLSDHRVEHVLVAELEGSLVRWLRDGTVPHGPAYLADERLSVSVADIRQVVAETPPESLDLVLLDVDNGPDFLVHEDNATLYEPEFLRRVRSVLRPGGVVVVWSSTEPPALELALEEVFGGCTKKPCAVVLQGREDTYWLLSAARDGRPDGQTDEGER